MDPAGSSSLNLNKILILFGALVVAMIVWSYINSPLVITTTGIGEVSVAASNATISISLAANDANPQVAASAVKQRIDAVTNVLISKGVAAEDIAQSQISTVPASLVTSGAQGFQSSATMGAKTTNISTISDLVAELYNAGAVVVSQPVLSVENQDVLEQQAFDAALKDAKKEAGTIALKNWKLIRKLVAVTQTSSPSTSTATTKADAVTQANNQAAIENGVFKIAKSVSVVYKLW